MKRISTFFLAISVGVFLTNIYATTFYVKANGGSDSNNGLTDGTAFLTISKALNLSSLADGDVIELDGTFKYNVGKYLTKSITLRGKSRETAILQGTSGAIKNCFNLTAKNGAVSLTVENITFENFDNYDELVAKQGGVINVTPGTTLICRNTAFKNNQCYIGGAINISGGAVTLEDCVFSDNKTKVRPEATNADGGAINVSLSATETLNFLVSRCLFENNSTENSGAAIRIRTVSTGKVEVNIENSTFTGNVTKEIGKDCGTVFLQGTAVDASIALTNNTFAYNKTEKNNKNANAAISINGLGAYVSLNNNILFSNLNNEVTPKSVSISTNQPLKEAHNNITDMTSKAFNFESKTVSGAASGNVNAVTAEQLGLATTLSNEGGKTNVLSITKQSVAIDAAYAEKYPKVDQRNMQRDNKPDIGAFELLKTDKNKK